MNKLLIPAVNGYSDEPNGFLYNRIISLFNHLNFYFLGKVYDKENGLEQIHWLDKELTHFWGKKNIEIADEYSEMIKEAKRK